MKNRILFTFIIMFVGCVANTKVAAQNFGVEQNQNGSYTLTFGDGSTITTNTNGQYTSTGTGSCSGCVQTLPEVTVYGYKNTSNTYNYTSYYYNNQYYNLPPDQYNAPPIISGGSAPQTVITTNPTPTPPPPPVNDPCKGVAQNPSPDNLTMPVYASALNSLTSTLNTDVNEKSMFLGVNTTNGTFMTTPITGGTGSSATGNPSYPNFVPFAGAHTHPQYTYPMPSAGDVYSLGTYNAQYPTYKTAYVISEADGSTTAITVTNPQKLATFLATYPQASSLNSNANWSSSTPMGADFNAAVGNLDPNQVLGSPDNLNAWRNAQAYILDKYDTGLTMVMKGADGTFKEIHYVKTTDAQGNISYKKYNCN